MSQNDSRGITAPRGFRAAGLHCGIKKAGVLDLALIVSDRSGPIAGVFTTNQVVAAPVTLDRLHLRQGVGRAILTTDLKPKTIARRARINGRTVIIGGMAKGSGMIHPAMATMLGYLTTDAAITRTALQRALRQAVDESFNCVSVDGDTSTNDTVLCLANGLAGNRPIMEGTPAFRQFVRLLTEACQTLALAICRDGEGVTKVVKIDVQGARNTLQAKQVANTIGTSNLVKTALFGEDANWGRVMAAIGRAGVTLDPAKIDVSFGGVPMVSKGVSLGPAAERRIAKVFRCKEFTIQVKLGKGRHRSHLWTTDLSYDYVRINASYRS